MKIRLEAAALMPAAASIVAGAILASCSLFDSFFGTGGKNTAPTAVFQIKIATNGSNPTDYSAYNGSYAWSWTAGTAGAYVLSTGTSAEVAGSKAGGQAGYIYNSYSDASVTDGLNGGAHLWFLSSSVDHSVTALDSEFNGANDAVPPSSGATDWCNGVLETADYSAGGAVPTVNPDSAFAAGGTLTTAYHYSDTEGDLENTGAAKFQWQTSSAATPTDGTFTNISGATSKNYTTSSANSGHYLRVVVTVAALTGTTAGTPSTSQPV